MESIRALIPSRFGLRISQCCWLAFFWLAPTLLAGAAESATNEPARVKVRGFGFLGNREMIRLLRHFQVNDEMPAIIDRTFVEDAALVLLARATDEGYLQATLRVDFKSLDGARERFIWTNVMAVALPPGFAAREARFRLNKGVRFYYETIEFEGLVANSERTARSYFVGGDMLLKLRSSRVFNPTALRNSLAALQEAYARAGYQDATVTTNEVVRDETTGAIKVRVLVNEGPISIARSVDVEIAGTPEGKSEAHRRLTPGQPYSALWQQDLAQQLRTEQHVKGYPDATVEFSLREREVLPTSVQMDVSAQVAPGPFIRLGEVTFAGNQRTETSVLASRVKLKEGEPLNRVEAEASRQRLARLGVFDSVGLRYEEQNDDTRDVIYEFKEIKPISLSLLGGFGSYELLRGGLEFQHRNLFGRAHSVRLRGLQSFKASKGDLLYTVPELFGENLNLFAQGTAELREEVSFNREEYGGAVGIQKRLVPIKTDLSVRYQYEFLNATDVDSTSTNRTGVEEAQAAAFVIELNRDRRDHPLLPRKGLKLFSRAEFASAALGGTVDYQRLLFGASYHHDLHGGRFLHLGLTHGLSFTWGADPQDLPFNKRYFPGGENSIRGYQQGEASPVDANGAQLGAETYLQANVEFEQLLTKSWSVVAFFDGIGFAEDRRDYPASEALYSVGAGLRWRTLIGPVRLEYGYNLNRRTHDPAGTLHFSVGFPF